MKKNYFAPEVELVELDLENVILAGSVGDVDGGGADGEYSGGTGSGDDPGFGGDY